MLWDAAHPLTVWPFAVPLALQPAAMLPLIDSEWAMPARVRLPFSAARAPGALHSRCSYSGAPVHPLAAVCNHSFSPNAKIAPGPSGAMCMVATRQGLASLARGSATWPAGCVRPRFPTMQSAGGQPAHVLAASGSGAGALQQSQERACAGACRRELKEGEAVLISYGNLQNDFLLMVRGGAVCSAATGPATEWLESPPAWRRCALAAALVEQGFLFG